MLKRIIFHWTAGVYTPNATDLEHYHYVIDDKGVVHAGTFKPENNLICYGGRYAAHTGGGNTGSIGIAFCGMCGFVDRHNVGKFPLIQKQIEAGFKLGAELAKKYKLNLDEPMAIQTHYGFGKRNPKTSSAGKIDIIYLPPYPDVKSDDVEDFIRKKVKWYFKK